MGVARHPPVSSLRSFLHNLVRHRAMIRALAVRELAGRYAGTAGGGLWAFAHPLAVVAIYYFVFAVGFRAQGPGNTPFILWFVCGFVAWSFFNETLQAITSSITSNPHLVKKTVFPTEVLPFVHLLAGLLHHAIFLFVLAGLLIYHAVPITPGRIMLFYFIVCSAVFLLGMGWLLAALQVFYRDVAQGLSILLNMWFWLTPIVWAPSIMPEGYRSLLIFNPVHYIVEGYRGALVFDALLWPDWRASVVFWLLTGAVFVVGAIVFRRLKPEFADVI